MPTLEVSLQVTQDGVPMPDLSLVRRLVVDGVVPFDMTFPSGGPTNVPVTFTDFQAALIRPLDHAVTISVAGAFQVNAGGFFLFFDGTSVTNIALVTTTATQVQGLEAGTT